MPHLHVVIVVLLQVLLPAVGARAQVLPEHRVRALQLSVDVHLRQHIHRSVHTKGDKQNGKGETPQEKTPAA
eukprot:1076438-Prorocentrum_minimum.AAC.2